MKPPMMKAVMRKTAKARSGPFPLPPLRLPRRLVRGADVCCAMVRSVNGELFTAGATGTAGRAAEVTPSDGTTGSATGTAIACPLRDAGRGVCLPEGIDALRADTAEDLAC